MQILVTLFDENGKRTGSCKVDEWDLKELAGVGVELKPAPFKEGFFYYPMDIMLGVLNRLGGDFFGSDFEIEEVCNDFQDYHPFNLKPIAKQCKAIESFNA